MTVKGNVITLNVSNITDRNDLDNENNLLFRILIFSSSPSPSLSNQMLTETTYSRRIYLLKYYTITNLETLPKFSLCKTQLNQSERFIYSHRRPSSSYSGKQKKGQGKLKPMGASTYLQKVASSMSMRKTTFLDKNSYSNVIKLFFLPRRIFEKKELVRSECQRADVKKERQGQAMDFFQYSSIPYLPTVLRRGDM